MRTKAAVAAQDCWIFWLQRCGVKFGFAGYWTKLFPFSFFLLLYTQRNWMEATCAACRAFHLLFGVCGYSGNDLVEILTICEIPQRRCTQIRKCLRSLSQRVGESKKERVKHSFWVSFRLALHFKLLLQSAVARKHGTG